MTADWVAYVLFLSSAWTLLTYATIALVEHPS